MRVVPTFSLAASAACVAIRALDNLEAALSPFELRHLPSDLTDTSALLQRKDTFGNARRSARLKRDDRVQSFFDEDFASEADWTKFTNKGGALMCGLNGDDEKAGQQMGDKRTPPSAASPWTGDLKQELKKWKWTEVSPSTYSCKMDDYWKIPLAMEALGLNSRPLFEGGDNICYRVEHWDPGTMKDGQRIPAINQWYNVDGIDYQSTKAHYEFGINTSGGAIYGLFLESPVHAASTLWHSGRRPADPFKLPQLRAFSDILWGYWARDNPNMRNVKYFFMLGISNDKTNALIASCLRDAGKELQAWPGVSFETSTDEGHALLGSPNGAAFAYFLMQHKRELGRKTIQRVTVLRAETDDDVAFVDPYLVFHVADVEGNEDENGRDDGEREAGRDTRALKL
ncbi:hypothetical protein SVAN01_08162 [Stagonosporopsis vannaccii]|nr:hypothetical protein SVAN01_08162 [Stagonosporopsis vannaccii]